MTQNSMHGHFGVYNAMPSWLNKIDREETLPFLPFHRKQLLRKRRQLLAQESTLVRQKPRFHS